MVDDKPLIVIVDDDFDVLEWCRLILEAAGFRAACFHNGEDAFSAMKKEMPALVITDLMMASLDSGFELARTIVARFKIAFRNAIAFENESHHPKVLYPISKGRTPFGQKFAVIVQAATP